MNEWLEDDGAYPTEAALERIAQWPHTDLEACFDFVKAIWHWDDWASETLRPCEQEMVRDEGRYLRLATGGWSGNESIVAAMNRNMMLRAMCWVLTTRGGLHIYRYPAAPEGAGNKPWVPSV